MEEVATSTGEATPRTRREKAQRIIAAMRDSVGKPRSRGLTFVTSPARRACRADSPACFGSKERLLVEVVRHDCEVRNRNMDERLAQATTADEILEALVAGLNEFLEDDQGGQAVIYEMLSASRHSDEIRAKLAELYRQWRERLAGWLQLKEEEGAIALDAPPRPWLRCCSWRRRRPGYRFSRSEWTRSPPSSTASRWRAGCSVFASDQAGTSSACFCKRSHKVSA